MPTTPPVRKAIRIARCETPRMSGSSPDSAESAAGVAARAAAATRTLLRTARRIPI